MSKEKVLNSKELRSKKLIELERLLREKLIQIKRDQMNLVTQKTKNTNILKPTRQVIARIKTVLAEKRELAKLEVPSQKGKI